ncbi:DUF6482 family protein [Pseudoalteromonas luteoviolacea]|uniref:Uncharacterized protein n=1 Tax=Pseudoalteromonas luteoviolacea NCIMB 1942 TaxID=1365253 RepID=A0A167H667_9GAMM|nr:DUF6482 family protein [Pseudoalteromonas luteoviolacea]KZN57676.1 hypothetical protein N482_23420 [Pseudoalteromonas luteoviolacea NCIMB 1942]KZW98955.1 hypothetical protein JL49_19815 [Pseudoalteromonas luteoviolacea]
MKITLAALCDMQPVTKFVANSLDVALYNLIACVGDAEYLVVDSKGEAIRARNPLALQKLVQHIDYHQMTLRHQSAYDEMIGQPARKGSNQLEVPFGDNKLY